MEYWKKNLGRWLDELFVRHIQNRPIRFTVEPDGERASLPIGFLLSSQQTPAANSRLFFLEGLWLVRSNSDISSKQFF